MRYYRLLYWQMTLLFAGYLIGFISGDVTTWYQGLNKSMLTPPNYVFGVVWSMLYLMIATSGWLIWEQTDSIVPAYIKPIFVAQLFLNWCWSPLFFTFHLVNIALLIIVMLILLVGYLVVASYNRLRFVSLVLIPYLFWLIFACYLNAYISLFN